MRQEGVSIRIARIFNTFGPRMHMNDGRVVSNFILQALQNDSITIYGNGKQTRSFQYVSDLVDGLVALMASNYTLPVNIGNPEEHTIEGNFIFKRNKKIFVKQNKNQIFFFRFCSNNKRSSRRNKQNSGIGSSRRRPAEKKT